MSGELIIKLVGPAAGFVALVYFLISIAVSTRERRRLMPEILEALGRSPGGTTIFGLQTWIATARYTTIRGAGKVSDPEKLKPHSDFIIDALFELERRKQVRCMDSEDDFWTLVA